MKATSKAFDISLFGTRTGKTALLVMAILWLLAALAGAQQLAADDDVSAKIRALERARLDAQAGGDLAALDLLLDNAVMWVEPDGTLFTKAQLLAKFHASKPLTTIATPSLTVRTYGTVAIVAGVYQQRGIVAGHAYLQRCRFISTWSLKKGKWLCIAVTAMPLP